MTHIFIGVLVSVLIVAVLFPVALSVLYNADTDGSTVTQTSSVIVAQQPVIDSYYSTNGTSAIWEIDNGASSLTGLTINKMSFNLKSTGSPTGTMQAGVFCCVSGGYTNVGDFGTLSATALTSTPTWYNFSFVQGTDYIIPNDTFVGLDMSGGFGSCEGTPTVDSCDIARSDTDTFDGVNSVYRVTEGTDVTKDVSFILYHDTETTSSPIGQWDNISIGLFGLIGLLAVLALLFVGMKYLSEGYRNG